ncbi:Small ribosomal subunit protein uS10m [Nakaseomyces bracarensis]|uniref:Small ribosomal subunit protein uS10m n=1 Tax=Nakaseomyces bracarensis TaxID=273131 RepID=A0ABR4NY22_9SACH
MIRTTSFIYRATAKRWQSFVVPVGEISRTKKVEMPITSNASATPKEAPINVEALYYAPLRNPIKHGDLVADLQLRSYDNENLDFFSDFIMRVGYYLGAPLTGPKPLPTRRERWTVIRSPFVHAKSKENFERHTHKRLIRVWDTNPEIVQMLVDYITKNSIAGVGLKCTVYQRASTEAPVEDVPLSQVLNTINESYPVKPNQDENEVIGAKVVEFLNSPEFKKHLEQK